MTRLQRLPLLVLPGLLASSFNPTPPAQARTGAGLSPSGPPLAALVAQSARTTGRSGAGAETAPAAAGPLGAIASADALATGAGFEILRAGGNAVDAAVATALALAVVYPEAGNLGGGGFAVVKVGETLRTLDFRETAPAAATANLYLDEKGEPRPQASLVGPLAAGAPGSPAGLYELQRGLGRLRWERVVEPARRLAAGGIPIDHHLHQVLAKEKTRQLLGRFPESAEVWLPGGEPPPEGSILRLPALAATLAAYAERGPEAITAGPAARAIEAASRQHGGILTAADLSAYRPVWREPLRFEAFGWKLASMPLPSSGGIILAQTFGLLERLGWAGLPRGGADRDHLLIEAFRRAFADRFLLGDPATSRATASQLLDPAWIDGRAASVDRGRATPSSQIRPWPDRAASAAAVQGAESRQTTHLSVIDSQGNMVALTTTLNGLFGCGLFVPQTGFFLNNQMDDFATAPGRPNLFGLIQGEANAVGPGKRMLSSMAPTLAWKGGEEIALGARGGSRIPTHLAQVLLAMMVDHEGLAAALARPRLHHQWLPDRLEAEAGALSPAVTEELSRRGHQVQAAELSTEVHAVRRLATGQLEAAADPRQGSESLPEHLSAAARKETTGAAPPRRRP